MKQTKIEAAAERIANSVATGSLDLAVLKLTNDDLTRAFELCGSPSLAEPVKVFGTIREAATLAKESITAAGELGGQLSLGEGQGIESGDFPEVKALDGGDLRVLHSILKEQDRGYLGDLRKILNREDKCLWVHPSCGAQLQP